MNKTRFVFALLFAFALPLAAFAGVAEDANGSWSLDKAKMREQLPFDTLILDTAKGTLTLKDSKSDEARVMRVKAGAATASTLDLEMQQPDGKPGSVLRVEMRGKKELSVGEFRDGKRKDILYFKR